MKNEKLKILIDTNVAITYISGREDKYADECVAIVNECLRLIDSEEFRGEWV